MQQPDQGRATSVTVAPPPQAASPQGFGRPVIVMKNAAKRFGDAVAVEGLNFTVHEGEIFGFIGPSGSGKTTTIRLMNGTYAPSEGSVTVFGEPAGAMPGRVRESIGYLPQLFILYPNLSVKENIDFSASLYGLSWFGRRKRRREVLEFVELWDHRGKLARDISGGMQRRLGLASSLIHDPRLIFLDEPTAGIDPILRAKFWDAFRELKAQGRSLFVTTQYVTEAEYCDHVAVLGHGQVIAVDTPENLRLAGVRSIDTSVPGRARLVVEDAPSSMPGVMEVLRGENIEVEGIEQYRPTFDDVFVRLVERHQEETGETLEEAARA